MTDKPWNVKIRLIIGKDGDNVQRKFFISFTISLVIFFLIFMVFYDSIFVKDSYGSDKETEELEPVGLEELDSEHSEGENELLFLLCGVAEFNLTDTMMLVNVNFDSGDISLLSIPRDTRVADRKIDKINAAHSRGGMPLTIATVNELLGVEIENYVKVDYDVVMDLVDIIGGVEIEVPFLMEYRDPTSNPPLNIYLEKGLQTLDGKKAHDFLRWRKNNTLTVQYKDGDLGRIKAQQYFVKELIKQVLNSDKLIIKLPAIINTYFKNVETNLPLNVMLNGVKLAKDLDTDNIVTNTLPGEDKYIDDISYFIYDEAATKALIEELY